MNSLKRCIIFSGLITLAATAFVSASSALASNTQLCTTDPKGGACANPVTHIHESTLAGGQAIIKTSILTVKCDVLFLSVSNGVGQLRSPQEIQGRFTYSSCNNNCILTEENGPAELTLLKTTTEIGQLSYPELLVHVECGSSIDCHYVGEKLSGTDLGALASTETNGVVTLSNQKLKEESPSFFCPDTSELTITTTPLSATYIGS